MITKEETSAIQAIVGIAEEYIIEMRRSGKAVSADLIAGYLQNAVKALNQANLPTKDETKEEIPVIENSKQ